MCRYKWMDGRPPPPPPPFLKLTDPPPHPSSPHRLKPTQNIDKMRASIAAMYDGGVFPEPDNDRPAFNIDSKLAGYCGLCNVPG